MTHWPCWVALFFAAVCCGQRIAMNKQWLGVSLQVLIICVPFFLAFCIVMLGIAAWFNYLGEAQWFSRLGEWR